MVRLNDIEDLYIKLGYRGYELRKALEKDKEYQKLLKQRKNKLSKNFNVTKLETKRHVLSLEDEIEKKYR